MTDEGLKPWEIHPALTRARLAVVGKAIWDARHSAASDASWEKGDNLWDIGCKAYSRAKYALARLAMPGGQIAGWLTIQDRSQHFVFSVGGVPVRMYNGDADEDAPSKHREPDPRERDCLALAFDLADTPTPDAILRIIVERNAKGFPTAVFLAQVKPDGSVVNPWKIPVDEAESVAPMGEARPDPVTPPRAVVLDEESEKNREMTMKIDIKKPKGA